MSAVNVLFDHRTGQIHLLTDGASYHDDGKVVGLGAKAIPLPHLQMVIATRGPAVATPMLAHLIGHAVKSFDHFRDNAPAIFAQALATMRTILAGYECSRDVDLVAVGTGKRGLDAFSISTVSDHVAPAMQLVPIRGLQYMPANDAISEEIDRDFPGGLNALSIDPVRDGLIILEIQRKHTRRVGGFAQLTSLRFDGAISTRIIRRWPDEIDQPLAREYAPITAHNGVIDRLAVRSMNLEDNAVIVPAAQNGGEVLGNGSFQLINDITIAIDTFGLEGKPVSVKADFVGGVYLFSQSGPAHVTLLRINGEDKMLAGVGGNSVNLAGLHTFIATGGVHFVQAQVFWSGDGSQLMSSRVLTVLGVKR